MEIIRLIASGIITIFFSVRVFEKQKQNNEIDQNRNFTLDPNDNGNLLRFM